MTVSIDQLRDAGKTLEVPHGDVSLSVKYRLSAIGKDSAEWLQQHSEDEDSMYAFTERLLASWGLTDSDGAPVPVTAENVKQYIPDVLLLAIVKAVLADAGVYEAVE
ncbi:MAG: hypothetical protein M3P51_15595, partial [Chloroflexota bacterium]|nr:hypothetical protein [Chloroflexota bacterium]